MASTLSELALGQGAITEQDVDGTATVYEHTLKTNAIYAWIQEQRKPL